jgi:excisionase family DNA binding protein
MKAFLLERLKWVEERDALQGIIDISPDDRLMDAIVDDVVKEAAKRGFSEIVENGQKLGRYPTLEQVRLFLTACLAGCKTSYLTPPQIAKALGVGNDKVWGWIRRGELVATNVTTKPGGRPRWRISKEDFDAFRKGKQPEKVPLRRSCVKPLKAFY